MKTFGCISKVTATTITWFILSLKNVISVLYSYSNTKTGIQFESQLGPSQRMPKIMQLCLVMQHSLRRNINFKIICLSYNTNTMYNTRIQEKNWLTLVYPKGKQKLNGRNPIKNGGEGLGRWNSSRIGYKKVLKTEYKLLPAVSLGKRK